MREKKPFKDACPQRKYRVEGGGTREGMNEWSLRTRKGSMPYAGISAPGLGERAMPADYVTQCRLEKFIRDQQCPFLPPPQGTAPTVLKAMTGSYLVLRLVNDIPLASRFTSLIHECSSESISLKNAQS